MNKYSVLLVGDKFSNFASHENVTTTSRLSTMLNVWQREGKHAVIIGGQGLSRDALSEAHHIALRSQLAHITDISSLPTTRDSAPAHLSHKRHCRNRLISTPAKIDDDRYLMDLLIDDECELMADHQTGEHVQGMVLIEACRQAFLAVTELYYLNQDYLKHDSHYFVIDHLVIGFLSFIFPLPASIDFKIKNIDWSRPNRPRFVVSMNVVQCDEIGMKMDVTFSVFDGQTLASKEHSLAAKAITSFLGKKLNDNVQNNFNLQVKVESLS